MTFYATDDCMNQNSVTITVTVLDKSCTNDQRTVCTVLG
ncbi:MAG: hypothetical protein IPL65_04650 [Lewinellaceae bacterium]|nr:hypothetical protein [Lewinellaceae bacterium]